MLNIKIFLILLFITSDIAFSQISYENGVRDKDLSFKTFKDQLSSQIKKEYDLELNYSLNNTLLKSYKLEDYHFTGQEYGLSLEVPKLILDIPKAEEFKLPLIEYTFTFDNNLNEAYYKDLLKEQSYDLSSLIDVYSNKIKDDDFGEITVTSSHDYESLLAKKIEVKVDDNIHLKSKMLSDNDLNHIKANNEMNLQELFKEDLKEIENNKDILKNRLSDTEIEKKEDIKIDLESFNYMPTDVAFNNESLFYRNEKFDERIAQIAPPKLSFGDDLQSPAFHRGVHSIYDKYLSHKYSKSESIFIDTMAGGFLNSTISTSVALGYNRSGNTYSLYLEKSQWLDTKTNTGKMIESAGVEYCPDLSFGMKIIQFKPCYKYVNGTGTFKERDPFGEIAERKVTRGSLRLYGRWILSVPDDFDKYFKEGLTRDIVSTEIEGYSGFSDDPFLWGWFGGLTIRTPVSGVSMNFENYMGQRFVFGLGYVWGRVL